MVTWQQIAQGEPNPFDITRTSTDGYTASYDEYVITDQSNITLPSPQQDAAVAVRADTKYRTVTVSTPSGSILDIGSQADYQGPEPAIFVSDGVDWYVQNDEQQISSTIPDSTTSRVADNGTSSGSQKHGMAFTLSDSFREVGFKISSNTGSGVTRAYLYNLDTATPVTDVDITSLGAGDTFTIPASYQANTEYAITLDAEGSTYSYGFNGSPSYPFTGSDVDIISGVDGQSTKQSGFAYTIVSIGDP